MVENKKLKYPKIQQIVENYMKSNDEITANQLQEILAQLGQRIILYAILHC